MPSSRGSSRPRDQTHVSYASCVGRQVLYHWSHLESLGTLMKVKVIQLCLTLCDPHGLYSPWNTPCQNTGVGSCSLLQGIFPIQESNPGLLHRRWILHQLSHQGTLIGTTKNKPFTKTLLSLTKDQEVDSWWRQKATDNNFSTIMKHKRRHHGPTSTHADKTKVGDLDFCLCQVATKRFSSNQGVT